MGRLQQQNSNTNSIPIMQNPQNKQNKSSQKPPTPAFLSKQPKSQSRYPLQVLPDVDTNFKNVQVYSPNTKSKLYNKVNFNQPHNYPTMNLFHSLEKSGNSISIKQRCKILQISSVHQLIATARSKKSEIEDLLRQEELKAELEETQGMETAASMRKLKKVVRLLQIVCKIILGRNQQNSYIDPSLQHDVSMRQMHSFSMENHERELASKNSQIQRLKKLVQILSAPNKEISHSMINSNSNSTIIGSVRNSLEKHEFSHEDVIRIDAQAQTELKQAIARIDQSVQQNMKLNGNFLLCSEYSLWNILDANRNQESAASSPRQIVENLPIDNPIDESKNMKMLQMQLKPASMDRTSKFGASRLHSIQIQAKCAFIKRFKSIVKITLNAINLCNNIFFKVQRSAETKFISSDILELTNYFNNKYHSQNGYYDDDFCKQIKDQISALYQRVHRIYKQANIDSDIFENPLP